MLNVNVQTRWRTPWHFSVITAVQRPPLIHRTVRCNIILLIVFNEAAVLTAHPWMCHKLWYKPVMTALCKHTQGCAESASCGGGGGGGGVGGCVTVAQRASPWTQHMLIWRLLSLFFLCVFLQPENEEKSIVYDNIGPNVCMGDHKVTKGAPPPPHLSVCLRRAFVQRTGVIICYYL